MSHPANHILSTKQFTVLFPSHSHSSCHKMISENQHAFFTLSRIISWLICCISQRKWLYHFPRTAGNDGVVNADNKLHTFTFTFLPFTFPGSCTVLWVGFTVNRCSSTTSSCSRNRTGRRRGLVRRSQQEHSKKRREWDTSPKLKWWRTCRVSLLVLFFHFLQGSLQNMKKFVWSSRFCRGFVYL